MGNPVSVTPGSGFTGATAVLNGPANDQAGFVTFTTSGTIPSSPYLIFTLTWGGSWAATYPVPPVVSLFPCANPGNSRSAAFMAAVAALGPFYAIPSIVLTTTDIYCTNAPATSTVYELGYTAIQGP